MIVGWDLETNQLNPFKDGAALLSAVAYCDNGRAVGGILDHPLATRTEESVAKTVEEIGAVLQDPSNTVVGHNICAFDLAWWEWTTGQRVEAQLFDTMVAAHLIDENAPRSLEHIAEQYGVGTKNEDGLNRKKLAEENPNKVLKYNIQDSWLVLQLYEPLRSDLVALDLLDQMQFSMDVARVLVDMTLTGICIDKYEAWQNHQEIQEEKEEVEERLYELIGRQKRVPAVNEDGEYEGTRLVDRDLNLRSPKQLRELLFEEYGMPVLETTGTGKPSTSVDVLRALEKKAVVEKVRDLLNAILDFRELEKLQGTYLKPLVGKHCGTDDRVHATFKVAGTATGRLSSSNPNLQNQPRDKRVKSIFVPTEGMRLFNADYSQLEIRVAAWYAQEPRMLEAFREGRDIHSSTLAEMEDVPYERVLELIEGDKEWKEKRALIKRVNFGVLYGVGPWRLQKLMRDMDIEISMAEAKRIINRWFEKYSKVKEWIDKVTWRIERGDGQVVTPLGRVRRLQGTSDREIRQGVNFMVQSLAGQIALAALVETDRFFAQEGGARLLVTVHDSVVGEYFPDDWSDEDLEGALRRYMVDETLEGLASRFGVKDLIDMPLDIDVETGDRWV